jgi:UDP-N-acetylmuramate dehydrogenase
LNPPPLVVRENVALDACTTLGVGGAARFFTSAGTEAEVRLALEFASARRLPVFILGGGSNLVVADRGFPGLVIRIALHGVHSEGEVLTAAAGEDWDWLVQHSIELQCAGIECLSGIPGTVGGTPVQNVGAYGQEVSDTIDSVRVLDRQTHEVFELDRADCNFAYRRSAFNTTGRERYVVLAVSFRLQRGGGPCLVHPELQKCFESRDDTPALEEVRNAVMRIREAKSMILKPGDPDARSAGSFFKNPIVAGPVAEGAEAVARRRGLLAGGHPLPRYPMPGGWIKLPAAWLVEHSGFPRGYRRANVGLSSKHALSMINLGGAKASEILELMRDIQTAVHNTFGVKLKPEPIFLGFSESEVL